MSPTDTPNETAPGPSTSSDLPMSPTADVLDLSTPSSSNSESSTLQEQVLDLSTNRIAVPESETVMTLHSGANITKPEEKPEGLKSPSLTKSEFKIKVVGVKIHKSKYSFRCDICDKIMHSVKEWNAHHRQVHSDIILNCEDCGKGFNVPSSLRDHHYDHRGQAYECETCHLKFTFYSGLQLHQNLHASSQCHFYFVGGCCKKYSWQQDLLHHLSHHQNRMYKCDLCAYKNQKRDC